MPKSAWISKKEKVPTPESRSESVHHKAKTLKDQVTKESMMMETKKK